jgi:hypothetical protein
MGSRGLRAPEADGAVLVDPPLADVERVLTDNRRLLDRADLDIMGRPLSELRRQARQSAVAAARDYLRQAGEPVPTFDDQSIVLVGHQPELFHPGVWIKNFVVNRLARTHGATPIHLIIDNDTAKTTAVRVPLQAHRPQPVGLVESVPFDEWTGEIPYEELQVRDEGLFASFSERVAAAMHRWRPEPILPRFWAEVCRHTQRTPLIGERLAAGRRTIERDWGCHNLELPISRLCATEPFLSFAYHLLTDLPRFHTIHNECLREYRRRFRLRSRSHPVPELTATNDWLEAPFWAWTADDPHRRRLMARTQTKGIELRIDNRPPVPTSQHSALSTQHSVKIRPRALTNTLFARLFLGDLFIHGIGGAKYDELTDMIIRRFYGIEPPRFMTVSGTLRLPLPAFDVDNSDCERLARTVRDLHWNPQRYLPADVDGRARALATQKEEWIARPTSTRPERRLRCQQLKALTADLRPFVAESEADVRQALQTCEQQLQANAVLRRRDYAFCLFSEAVLRDFLFVSA